MESMRSLEDSEFGVGTGLEMEPTVATTDLDDGNCASPWLAPLAFRMLSGYIRMITVPCLCRCASEREA